MPSHLSYLKGLFVCLWRRYYLSGKLVL